jgi:hypothetical protein
MGSPKILLPAALVLLAACTPPQVSWAPRRPTEILVELRRGSPELQRELHTALVEALGADADAHELPVNRVVLSRVDIRPDPRSGFWKTWGFDILAGFGAGAAGANPYSAALGLAFGIVAGPFDHLAREERRERLGYRPFVVSGELFAGAVGLADERPRKLLDLPSLDLEPFLPALTPEEAKDPARLRRVTANALAAAIRAELHKRGVAP